MAIRLVLILVASITLSGCWNGGNTSVKLGDISIGTQLLDLKAALDSGAISEDEFEETKEALLAINSLCERDESDETSWF